RALGCWRRRRGPRCAGPVRIITADGAACPPPSEAARRERRGGPRRSSAAPVRVPEQGDALLARPLPGRRRPTRGAHPRLPRVVPAPHVSPHLHAHAGPEGADRAGLDRRPALPSGYRAARIARTSTGLVPTLRGILTGWVSSAGVAAVARSRHRGPSANGRYPAARVRSRALPPPTSSGRGSR